MTDEEYQIRRKYENRNLMQELDWVAHYPPSGMSNQDRDFIKWLAMTAYDKINELEQTSVPVHDMELILHEVAKPQWIPVTERLPVGGDDSGAICENVCLLMDDGTVSCGWMNGITKKVYYLNARDDVVIKAPINRVTHWMPLPEPPKEGE